MRPDEQVLQQIPYSFYNPKKIACAWTCGTILCNRKMVFGNF
jgi:hypothetical protein